MNFFNMGEGTFSDALASLEFKLSVGDLCFSASGSTGLLEFFCFVFILNELRYAMLSKYRLIFFIGFLVLECARLHLQD